MIRLTWGVDEMGRPATTDGRFMIDGQGFEGRPGDWVTLVDQWTNTGISFRTVREAKATARRRAGERRNDDRAGAVGNQLTGDSQ